jgi:hypothetical protein
LLPGVGLVQHRTVECVQDDHTPNGAALVTRHVGDDVRGYFLGDILLGVAFACRLLETEAAYRLRRSIFRDDEIFGFQVWNWLALAVGDYNVNHHQA